MSKAFAFLGRVSTEDNQDPEASRGWQIRRAKQIIEQVDGTIVAEYFDIGQSRSIPWKRRPRAAALLEEIKRPGRPFDAVVTGEPQRAFYGNQFGLTFPVLTHYGVELWVPEVGGRIDPGSEAHDIVMTLFGGMSKGERTRIQLRTKASMTDLALKGDRHMGGRPPYGYRLVDAGPHPNPSKAADGKRRHGLALDDETAPTVRRIFRMYADGQSFRAIADVLTTEGVPSPSAHDPARNPHRDPVGWAHTAVRAILMNENYSGYRVWGKQRKQESLIDPEDVAAGNVTRMRWNSPAEWVRATTQTHPVLIEPELMSHVRQRLTEPGNVQRRLRSTSYEYPLRGILFCGICGHRMQGAAHSRVRKDGSRRILYRCSLRDQRSLPPAAYPEHPRSLTVNESTIVSALDTWIGSLATPKVLASIPGPESEHTARASELRQKIKALDKKINALVATAEVAEEVAELAAMIKSRSQERQAYKAELAQILQAAPTKEDLAKIAQALGGVTRILTIAGPQEKGQLYRTLGLHLAYHPGQRRVEASLALGGLDHRNGGRANMCPEGELSVIPTTSKAGIPRISGSFRLAG